MKLTEEQLFEMEKHVQEFRDFIKERKFYFLQSKASLYKNIHNYWLLFNSLVNLDTPDDEVKRYLILLHKVFDTMPNVDKLKAVTTNPFLRHFVVFDFNKIMKEKRWVEILAFCHDLVLNDHETQILLKYKDKLLDGIEDSLKKRVYLDYRRVLVKIGVSQRKKTIRDEYLKSMTKPTIENIKWDIKFLFDLGYDADEIVVVMKTYFDKMKTLINVNELLFMYDLIQYVNDRELSSFWSVVRIFLFMIEHMSFEKNNFTLDTLEKYYYEYSLEKPTQTTIDILGSSLEHETVLKNKLYLYKRTRFLWEKYKHDNTILGEFDQDKSYIEYTRELTQIFKIFSKFFGRSIANYKEFVFNLKSLYLNEALIWAEHPTNSEKYLSFLVNILLLISAPLLKSVNDNYVNANNLLSFIDFYRIKMEELYFSNTYSANEVIDTFRITDPSNKISYEFVENGLDSLKEQYYLFYSDLIKKSFSDYEIENRFRLALYDNVIKKIDGIDALRVINKEPFMRKLLKYDISKILKETEALDFIWWSDIAIFKMDEDDKAKLLPHRDKLLSKFNNFKQSKNRPAQFAFGSLLAQLNIIKDKRTTLEIFVEFDDTPTPKNVEEDFITMIGYLTTNGYSVNQIIDSLPFFKFSFKGSEFENYIYDKLILSLESGKEIIRCAAQILSWEIYLNTTDVTLDKYDDIIKAINTMNFTIRSYGDCFPLFYNYELTTLNVNHIILGFNGEAFRLNVNTSATIELYGVSKMEFSKLVEHNATEILPIVFDSFEQKVTKSFEEEILNFIKIKLNNEKRHKEYSMYVFNKTLLNKLIYILAFKELVSNEYAILWETRDKLKKLVPNVKEITTEDLNYYSLIILTDFINKNIK